MGMSRKSQTPGHNLKKQNTHNLYSFIAAPNPYVVEAPPETNVQKLQKGLMKVEISLVIKLRDLMAFRHIPPSQEFSLYHYRSSVLLWNNIEHETCLSFAGKHSTN
jgi:hypothetical protein